MDSIQEWAASSHWMILFRMSHGDQFVPVEVCFEIAILTPCSQDLVGVAGKVDDEFYSPASWTQPVRKHIQKPSRFKSPEDCRTGGFGSRFPRTTYHDFCDRQQFLRFQRSARCLLPARFLERFSLESSVPVSSMTGMKTTGCSTECMVELGRDVDHNSNPYLTFSMIVLQIRCRALFRQRKWRDPRFSPSIGE